MPSIYEQEQANSNWLSRLKNMVSPTSTAGMLGNQDAYAMYLQRAIEQGIPPISRMEYLKMLQDHPEMAQSLQRSGGQQQGY